MVTRFSPGVKYSTEMGVYSPSMNVRSGGNYTLYDDYAKLEAENKDLRAYANNIIKCLNEYEDSQTSEEYKQTLDDFHHGVFLLSEGIAKL